MLEKSARMLHRDMAGIDGGLRPADLSGNMQDNQRERLAGVAEALSDGSL